MNAIEVNKVSKMYRLGAVSTGTLSHDLNRWWHKVRGLEDPYIKIAESNSRESKGDSDYVWSLKDIDFTVPHGEILGIIGRNGAGKSTLLKILSRVTGPTTGSIKMNGRVASLLEVGTGFHPELTGRENVFLNGAILGMTKSEIKSKFDEIIDFAGVERYIDTPVKRYSSGMYVRLAFGVAAHLEPEILIIDEVLAVGDAEFQKKCLGKMKDVSDREGRTVLFVSHNMAAVKSLCDKALVLEQGQVKMSGDTDTCISHYLKGGKLGGDNVNHFTSIKSQEFNLTQITFNSAGKTTAMPLEEKMPLEMTTYLDILSDEPGRFVITYHLNNELGESMFSFGSADNISLKQGNNVLSMAFPANFFQSGTFFISVFIVKDRSNVVYHERDILSFTVVDSGRQMGVYMGREPGYIRPQFEWQNKSLS